MWRARFRWRLPLEQVTGDTTYGTIDNSVALENAGIRAYISLPDFEKRTLFFGRSAFSYNAVHDQYTCPNGALLPRRKAKYTERVFIYQADAATCNACPLKAKCTEAEHGRQVGRHFVEAYLDRVRSYHQTEAYKKAMRKRKVWVEPLFGEGKQWHGMERFRLHTLEKVNDEGLLIAIGQNLKRLLGWRGWGRRWWPGGAIGVVIPSHFCVYFWVPA